MSSIPPPVTRLNSNLTQQDSDKWAENTKSAILNNSEVHSATVPGVTGPVLGGNSTGLDTIAKSQQDVDKTLGYSSSISTPGRELPGAWTDQPASGASQVYNDVSNVLTQAGQTAYGALPEGVKGAFSSESTSTPSVATTTNTRSAPGTGSSVTETVSNAASSAKSALASAYDKMVDAYSNTNIGSSPSSANFAGKNAFLSTRQGTIAPGHKTSAPDTQDKQGPSHDARLDPIDSVGALPNTLNERSDTAPPEDKVHGKVTGESGITTYSLLTRPDGTTSLLTTTSYPPITTHPSTTSTSATLTGVVATVGATFVRPYVPGLSGEQSNTDRNNNGTSLPSEETKGAEPGGRGVHPVGGVGALPGSNKESAVALLPHEKANPDPLSAASTGSDAGKQNARLASPYDSGSPYSNTNDNIVNPPHSNPAATSNNHTSDLTSGASTKDKFQPKTVVAADKSTDKGLSGRSTTHEEAPRDKFQPKTLVAADKSKDKVLPGRSTTYEEVPKDLINQPPATGKSSVANDPSYHVGGYSNSHSAVLGPGDVFTKDNKVESTGAGGKAGPKHKALPTNSTPTAAEPQGFVNTSTSKAKVNAINPAYPHATDVSDSRSPGFAVGAIPIPDDVDVDPKATEDVAGAKGKSLPVHGTSAGTVPQGFVATSPTNVKPNAANAPSSRAANAFDTQSRGFATGDTATKDKIGSGAPSKDKAAFAAGGIGTAGAAGVAAAKDKSVPTHGTSSATDPQGFVYVAPTNVKTNTATPSHSYPTNTSDANRRGLDSGDAATKGKVGSGTASGVVAAKDTSLPAQAPFADTASPANVKSNAANSPHTHDANTQTRSSGLDTADNITKDKFGSGAAGVAAPKDKSVPPHGASSATKSQGFVNTSPSKLNDAIDSPHSRADNVSDAHPRGLATGGALAAGGVGAGAAAAGVGGVKDKALPRHPGSPNTDAHAPGSGTGSGSGHASSFNDSSIGRKAGFMDKVKGEVKVISGKISGNEEKVEQGRALKSGNSALLH